MSQLVTVKYVLEKVVVMEDVKDLEANRALPAEWSAGLAGAQAAQHETDLELGARGGGRRRRSQQQC